MNHSSLQSEAVMTIPLLEEKENLVWKSENEKHTSRILKYGETMESFFLWHKHSGDVEYQNCCRTALDTTGASLEQQAAAWRRLLELRRGGDSADLLRWHRRATSYFTSRLETTDVTRQSHLFRTDWLHIWLSYAMLQAPTNKDAARQTLKQVQHLSGAMSLPATFYIAWSQLESTEDDPSAAEQILRDGLRRKAEPILDLHQAMQQLHPAKRFKEDRTLESSAPSQEDSNMSLDDTEGESLITSPATSIASPGSGVPTKDSLQFQLQAPILRSTPTSTDSPVLRSATPIVKNPLKGGLNESIPRTPSTDAPVPSTFLTISMPEVASGSSLMGTVPSQPRLQIPPFVPRTSKVATPPSQETVAPQSGVKDGSSLGKGNQQGTALSRIHMPPSKPRGSVIPPLHPPANLRHRQPLASKRPPLKTFGLGKAERVDPSQSILEMDSEDEITKEDRKPRSTTVNSTPVQPRKISKMDLEYMMNWDPEKNRRPSEPTTTDQPGGTPSLSSCSCSNASEKPGTPSGDRVNVEAASRSMIQNVVPESSTDRPFKEDHSIPPVVVDGASSTGRNKVNADFLPLIYESNVIRVNDEPYAKLGVIGKGGSCKVYRVLSRDGSVWALKRVKLQDLDRKAMDGYANEIALLNRLRGNPSIIQLQDSEVDLARKVILLVMEAGEADLNHVLQRQSLQQGSSSGQSLNMNFIRLTWQQMLKAVHSIHEQRIIHGDLKPANFLFVRGTLKLIDFGIAKAIQNDNTNHIYRESQIGTLNYMSPEAICDSGTSSLGQRMKCGRPSDIWSLGCILYQMVYGKTPFADLHMIPKLQAIVNPSHKIAYPPTADEAAIDAIQCCLRRKPQDRAPIVGTDGLLNEHHFLNSRQRGN